jgi:hypothetical protein
MEHCENCGRVIGQLETPRVYRQRVVCAECHDRLTAAPALPPLPAPMPTAPVYVAPPTIIVDQPRGTSALGVVSLVLGVLALLVAWVPFCGVIGWPLAIVGAICGVLGMLLSFGGRTGLSTPAFGTIFCLIAVVLPFVLPAAAVVGGAAQRIREIERKSNLPATTRAM